MSNKIIFQFDDNLEYQKKAVKSVVELFRGLPKTIDSIYAEKIRKTRITEKDPVRNIDIVKGEKLLITGNSTGAMFLNAEEIRYDLNPVDKAEQGWRVSIPVPDKVRPNDKLFKLVTK